MRDLWRSIGYCLIVFPSALAMMIALPLLVTGVLLTGVGGIGLIVVPRMMLVLRRWAEWHRGRAAGLLHVTIEKQRASMVGWRELVRSPESRRDLRWMLLHVGVGLPIALAAIAAVSQVVNALLEAPLWWLFPHDDPLRLLVVFPVRDWPAAIGLGLAQAGLGAALSRWGVPKLARLHARMCLAALQPSVADRMAERIGKLTESRSGVLDAHAAELRRIERDLHDGTQARLVAIAMRLAVAREALGDDTGIVARLVKEAHEGTEEAMTELRQVIRSIYPPILADRGLSGAVTAIAARAGLPVETDLDGLAPVPAAVETAAYFIVAESITNATKHSGATQVSVRLAVADTLRIEITDDGRGGIDESRGTGIAGIRLRTAALDGTVTVDSPAGGPTAITVELPCAS
ncbi:sensor histidine kinase [Streptosporangium pseudovulgare]|uniref:histidine kinase n=1 Tax=Streptosporangium pseudovulgare TaxID=35765 RepID=A0ABQ2R9P1_9ACTN|nr:sensor histidine kinase [Streptosporangium pseudovulgare]GGQ17984.1 histidine kinase [Streptosporangium pseudovulgare]